MFKYLFFKSFLPFYLNIILFCTAKYLQLCSTLDILLQNNKKQGTEGIKKKKKRASQPLKKPTLTP